jgi:hypothetical protein
VDPLALRVYHGEARYGRTILLAGIRSPREKMRGEGERRKRDESTDAAAQCFSVSFPSSSPSHTTVLGFSSIGPRLQVLTAPHSTAQLTAERPSIRASYWPASFNYRPPAAAHRIVWRRHRGRVLAWHLRCGCNPPPGDRTDEFLTRCISPGSRPVVVAKSSRIAVRHL